MVSALGEAGLIDVAAELAMMALVGAGDFGCVRGAVAEPERLLRVEQMVAWVTAGRGGTPPSTLPCLSVG
ncbi:hypothetical protein OG216_06010 [Streptomycetaceae bacterium NBC_01309]